MDFINELNTLRNERLSEISDERNKEALKKFTDYMINLLNNNKEYVQDALRNFVKNMPSITTPSITKEYMVPSDNSKGFDLFFKQEGGKNVKDFIKNITETTYEGFHITIKDSTEYTKSSSNSYQLTLAYKITVRYEVNLSKTE